MIVIPILKQCGWHSCTKIVEDDVKYCEYHKGKADIENKKRYREYSNRRRQDEEQKKYQDFYNSKEWIRLSEYIKWKYFGMCVICLLRDVVVDGVYTHHIEELSDRFDLRLDIDNLIALCPSCHRKVHKEYNSSKKDKEQMQRILIEACIQFNKEYCE